MKIELCDRSIRREYRYFDRLNCLCVTRLNNLIQFEIITHEQPKIYIIWSGGLMSGLSTVRNLKGYLRRRRFYPMARTDFSRDSFDNVLFIFLILMYITRSVQ